MWLMRAHALGVLQRLLCRTFCTSYPCSHVTCVIQSRASAHTHIHTYTHTHTHTNTHTHTHINISDIKTQVFATGFGKSYGFLSPALVQQLDIDDDGLYLYRCLFFLYTYIKT